MSTPLIIAHRGASADAPEHTLAAFELAWSHGADGIETDVHLTADGHIVAFHDPTTARTAGVDLAVARTTLAELRRLDVGSWFSPSAPRFAGQRVPTLAEVLATVPPGKYVLVEVKTGPGIVAPLRDLIGASGVAPDLLRIISFDPDAIIESKRLMPQIRACWITAYRRDPATDSMLPTPDAVIETLRRIGADGLDTQANSDAVTPELVARLRAGGFDLHCWTIDDERLADRFAALGVDSITTNRPRAIREHLRRGRP